MEQQADENCSVWLNDAEQIVSFHFIAGYREEKFNRLEFFWSYVQTLVGTGYRFQ